MTDPLRARLEQLLDDWQAAAASAHEHEEFVRATTIADCAEHVAALLREPPGGAVMASDPIAGRLAEAERDIVRLTHAVGTLITWMAQAANTPIRGEEAETLLNILHGVEPSIPEAKR